MKTIWDQVAEDMKARDEFGLKKYGRHLSVHDGRDTLKEIYAEMLDGVVYMRKLLNEWPDLTRAITILKLYRNDSDWQRMKNQFLRELEAGQKSKGNPTE